MVVVKLSTAQLLGGLAAILSVDFVILATWMGVDRFMIKNVYEKVCMSDSWPIFSALQVAYKIILLMYQSVLAYRTRDVPDIFNEVKMNVGFANNTIACVAVLVGVNVTFNTTASVFANIIVSIYFIIVTLSIVILRLAIPVIVHGKGKVDEPLAAITQLGSTSTGRPSRSATLNGTVSDIEVRLQDLGTQIATIETTIRNRREQLEKAEQEKKILLGKFNQYQLETEFRAAAGTQGAASTRARAPTNAPATAAV
eukprot:TRINITY_DN1599_c0_g1_i3.p1 TRINITY_DN1599_c0_g1~~TRINITY_DN1599_c0_g1_i3.p1  ORF type:complete len:255 (+),score=72.29 TRINITY_DN1599_c0_g1_i3:144-908(+)